jgi:sterol desaturase/sphingolipid hydroxylase (fatty acid hydroxylase superfamily)
MSSIVNKNHTSTWKQISESNSPDHLLATNPPPNARYIDKVWAAALKKYTSIQLTFGASFWIHTGVYWSCGLSLLAFEFLSARSKALKTQPRRAVTMRELTKLFRRVIGNQVLLYAFYSVIKYFKPKPLVIELDKQCQRPPPSYLRIAGDYMFNLGVFEVVFYVFHRTLHDQRWYKHVHKIHHQFKAPIGLAAEYAHIVELFLSNIVPGAIGPALSNAHPVSTMVWLVGSIIQTCFHHSGLMLPFYPLNQWTIAHDWHHKAFMDQFGVVGLMDGALGTTGDDSYTEFSSEIWKRTSGTMQPAISNMVRVASMATMAILKKRTHLSMPSNLFQSVVR